MSIRIAEKKRRVQPSQNNPVRVSDEDFIRIWQSAASATAAAATMGITLVCASTRASRLRGLGIPLRTFRRGTSKDIAALTEIAKKAAGKGATS